MFGPWIETYVWFKSLLPSFSGAAKVKGIKGLRRIRLPSANFILLHYTYLISVSIIGSIILFPAGNLDYVDALFFGSGCATQSGLNTVDLNKLYLYQQITLMLLACIANPIFINTIVVFVRLYWFEKRFQNVVLEAQRYRRTRERSRTLTEPKEDADGAEAEKGVGDRTIVVMHPSERTMDVAAHHRKSVMASQLEGDNSSASSSAPTGGDHESSSTDFAREEERDAYGEEQKVDAGRHSGGTDPHSPEEEEEEERGDSGEWHRRDSTDSDTYDDNPEPSAPIRREITFADEVKSPSSPTADQSSRMPLPQAAEHHIAFVEKQRNPKDTGALYIPGPRDFDRGHRPQEVDDDDHLTQISTAESPVATRSPSLFPADGSGKHKVAADDPLRKKFARRLSFEDTALAISKARKGVLAKVKFPDRHTQSTDGAEEEGETEEERELPSSLRRRGRTRTFASLRKALSEEKDEGNPMPYLSYQPTIGRNSAFVNLNEQQREELGGIEYRALKTLAMTLCAYYVGFHLLGMVCLTPWIVYSSTWGPVVDNDGVSRVWWGFFTPASLFNDLGFTLTPDSMISFNHAIFPLMLGSWLIIIGNTGFPCWLRLVIWVSSKLVPKNSSLWEEFRFLLDHPRRCFTLLFPSKATWWLFWILVILNVLDVIFFIVLDLNDPILTKLPAGIRVLNGWFQAASTRTAGFAVVNLSLLHVGCQVSYLIMMYISVFPIAISVRRTNVYEERSLGIWASQDPDGNDEANSSYVGSHLRRQLSFDLWYIFLGLFIICIVEGDRLKNTNDYAFTVFSVLFEIVSAYGTVGLSLGYPGTDTSFSAQFRVISKLVIIAMQLRGRHRGLPYALDKAILLPSEERHQKETEHIRRTRTQTTERRFGDEDDEQQPTLPRVGTERSGRSTYSSRSQRKGGWKHLVGSAMSAGPSAKRID